MGKPTICIGENKDADQLRGNLEADQRLCFRYSDSTTPNLLKSEISSFKLFSVLVQAGLCRTCSETTLLVFPRGGSIIRKYFSSSITFPCSDSSVVFCYYETNMTSGLHCQLDHALENNAYLPALMSFLNEHSFFFFFKNKGFESSRYEY